MCKPSLYNFDECRLPQGTCVARRLIHPSVPCDPPPDTVEEDPDPAVDPSDDSYYTTCSSELEDQDSSDEDQADDKECALCLKGEEDKFMTVRNGTMETVSTSH